MEDEKVNLSALDPAEDPARWERLVGSITTAAVRARAARLRPHPIVVQLAGWSRPALAAAAAIALVASPALVASAVRAQHPAPAQVARTSSEPASALMAWAVRDEMPSPEELFETLEGDTRGHR